MPENFYPMSLSRTISSSLFSMPLVTLCLLDAGAWETIRTKGSIARGNEGKGSRTGRLQASVCSLEMDGEGLFEYHKMLGFLLHRDLSDGARSPKVKWHTQPAFGRSGLLRRLMRITPRIHAQNQKAQSMRKNVYYYNVQKRKINRSRQTQGLM
jgi:hypothetical protein